MKIITNYTYPILSNKFQIMHKNNNQPSFEGLKINNAKKYLIYAPMALAALGLGSCKNTNPEDIPQAHWDYIMATENARMENFSDAQPEQNYDNQAKEYEATDINTMKDTTDYNPIIDKFMQEDKTIVKVEKYEGDDARYVNAYRIFCADGYNNRGKLVRQIVIHANEPSVSTSDPTYGPEGIEKTYYYPNRTVTEYCTNDKDQKLEWTEIEYKGTFSLNGKAGYKKSEIINEEPDEGRKKLVTYIKGETSKNDGVEFAEDKSYHRQDIWYDENGNKISVHNYRPNEYGEIVDSNK